jgi:hypothetical protein
MKYEINLNEVKKSFTSQKTQCVFITKTRQSIPCVQIDYGCGGNDDCDDDNDNSIHHLLTASLTAQVEL